MERDELVSIRWELWEVSVLLLAFVIAQFAYYACLPYLLKMASATALNLSLLATDYYTVVAGMVFFNYKVLFWVLSVPKVILLQAAEFSGLTLLVLGLIEIKTVLANFNNPRPSLILNNLWNLQDLRFRFYRKIMIFLLQS